MAAARIPNEIKLKIIESLGIDDYKLFLLRVLPNNDSYISRLLQSREIGDHLLERYETHHASDSVRPPLDKYDHSQIALRSRREKETLWMQHMLGRPCQQICNKPVHASISGTVAGIHPILKGGYFAYAAYRRLQTCIVLYDIVNTIFFGFVAGNQNIPGDITGMTLTDRLLVFTTTKTIWFYRLADIGSSVELHRSAAGSFEVVHPVSPQLASHFTRIFDNEPTVTLGGCDEYIAVLGKLDSGQACVYLFESHQGSYHHSSFEIPHTGSAAERLTGILLEKQECKDGESKLIVWVFVANALPGFVRDWDTEQPNYVVRGTAYTKTGEVMHAIEHSYCSLWGSLENTIRRAGFEFVPTGDKDKWQVNMSRCQAVQRAETHSILLYTGRQPRMHSGHPIQANFVNWKGMCYIAWDRNKTIKVEQFPPGRGSLTLGRGAIRREAKRQVQRVFVNDSFLISFSYDARGGVFTDAFTFDQFIQPPNARVLKRWQPDGAYSWRVAEGRWNMDPGFQAHTQRSEWRPHIPRA